MSLLEAQMLVPIQNLQVSLSFLLNRSRGFEVLGLYGIFYVNVSKLAIAKFNRANFALAKVEVGLLLISETFSSRTLGIQRRGIVTYQSTALLLAYRFEIVK